MSSSQKTTSPAQRSKKRVVQPLHGFRHVGIPQDERDIPARRSLRYHSQRNGVERRDGSAEHLRIVVDVFANRADDGHLSFTRDVGKASEALNDRGEVPWAFDSNGDADL